MLYSYDPGTKKLKNYSTKQKFNSTSICITPDKNVWCSTSDGHIEKYNLTTDEFWKLNVFEGIKTTKPRTIEKIYAVSDSLILIGTSHHGLILFNPSAKTFKNLQIQNQDGTPVFVRDILKYSESEYWIATESGIFIYNIVIGSYLNIRNDTYDPYSISNNSVFALCKDGEGGVWVGTFFGGLNYYPKISTPFKKYFSKGENSLSGNIVREICKDKHGNFWIGTEDAGLNKFNPVSGTFSHFLPSGSKTDVSYHNIHGLRVVDNELWIGTYEHGLDVLNMETGKVIQHFASGSDSNSLKSNFIVTIFKTSDQEILVGTYLGLYKYNRERNNFSPVKQVPPEAFVYTIYEDHSGTLWVGTIGDGVYYFNPNNGEAGKFDVQNIKNNTRIRNNIIDVFEDSRHNIWLASEGSGVSSYNPEDKTFTNYSTDEGLPSNFVFKILEDEQKHLWMSSSKGLVRFDQFKKTFKVYTASYGILSSQFNYNSGYKDDDGRLYFGSLAGMISFNLIVMTTLR